MLHHRRCCRYLFDPLGAPEPAVRVVRVADVAGDEQVAAVVRSKISKKKLQSKIDEEQEAGK